jgi:hypothetical protein
MNLPIRLLEAPTSERVVSVDGAWNQPGLNLSHWPGNATPAELKRDLSTGIALAFMKLDPARRAELARGCTALANNHYDTDGVCALVALRFPAFALEHETELLEIAAAGDLFQHPNDRAFQVDCTLAAFAELERSPWRAELAGLAPHARRERVLLQAVEVLPGLIGDDLELHTALWREPLERLHRDRAALADSEREELVHLDLAIWTNARAERFDPGRHALFGTSSADRALAIGVQRGGNTYRLVINTTSWFDLETPRLARPSLETLAKRLNELEGTDSRKDSAWRAQTTASPAPELWFGRADQELFAEHNAVLDASRLDPIDVKRELIDALRAAWSFPDEA